LGFAHASQPLLTILDADLTMPPEMLGRFYEAYAEGHADFVNGSRLIYPMEGEAMQFLNRLGNVFFAKALSWVLDTRLSDSLCGTKLVARHDYQRMIKWRADFGDFDPFGDFELLFPAAVLGLSMVDVPVRYRARQYGSTNIHRFGHGWQLLRMTWIGLLRIKSGKTFQGRQAE
jgi:glycosyltransferase involved in cell wall biosynthesis